MPEAAALPSRGDGPVADSTGRRCILVVDDRPTTREILTLVLQQAGYRVDAVGSGNEAQSRLELAHFDLVLTDLVMPVMTGLELLRRIRDRFSRTELPVIILTVRDREVDVVESLRLGANDYVTKPVNHTALLARMETHLNLRDAVLALTREKLAAEARNVALEEANYDLDAFSFTVAHDLRAPLRGIRGFAEALLEDYHGGLDDTGLDYLNRILSASRRMDALVSGLMSLARASRQSLEVEHVDLSALAREVWERMRREREGPPPRLTAEPRLLVEGDRQLLRLVVENLLDNAWKYSAGGLDPQVRFGARFEGGRRLLYVADNGVGFPAADRERVFRVFERTHGADFDGTGVGLAIVQRIVRRHGGLVWAESDSGNGTTVSFTLGRRS